jgi:tRNA dimethylallyltransferase
VRKQGKLNNKTVIIILGPTAVGKTGVALQLAQQLQTSIISADSRQCFKELNIGVAKPSREELAQIPHYFVNSHSITEEVNAALFEKFALQKANEIFQTNNIAVMVGGTGLYIRAFCEGLDDIPAIEPALKEELKDKYSKNGLTWLQEEVRKNDPTFFDSSEAKNPQRLMRALEVKLSTDRSILAFRTSACKLRSFKVIKIGLELPKEELHQHIHCRTENMITRGLLDEVRRLLPFRHLNALQTVGYSELFNHLEGKWSIQEAVELIKRNTRQYAKRQMTWFRKDPSIQWMPPGNWEQLKKITQY